MKFSPDQIIRNLIPDEPVVIVKVQSLGSSISITYNGIISKRVGNTILNEHEIEKLEIICNEGSFNFQGDPTKFLLCAEAERIKSAYQYDPLFAMNCSIIDPLPHQVEAVYKYLLPLPRIRFLLADDTGAGKTIMTGLLLKELLMRSYIRRILIVTPGGLTKQWQEDELGVKFNLYFKLVNRETFRSDPNVFSSSDKLIVSIDFLRQEDVLNVVKETSWDMIVVDEAHKLSAFDYGNKRYLSKRYKALEVLASRCDHVLLLTATPHRGRKDTFKNLLQILDEDIFSTDTLVTSRIRNLVESGVNKFFIRRLKEEMKDWDGNPLFKSRYTKTVMYELTPQEKKLYDDVTDYLQKERSEAKKDSNIFVSLALMVMQRRLTSSIYAIMKTLNNRYNALKSLLDELSSNPNLWKQKVITDLDIDNIEDFDELNDQERDSLENILSDPKKFRLFTTAKSIGDIKLETEKVKNLLDLAESLYHSNTEEKKFQKLSELLQNQGVLDSSEKLVIFTEHKDTLDYLEKKLKNNGYLVETIYGGMNVDERRSAQIAFSRQSQILIATDAAGEGINLQFCRLLINWDIPWNPNRLEQRMGRIHRYGQKQDVLVFNMVAQNTREGKVLERILSKLDVIREQMGDDRVYDVISDIFEGVDLDDIINSTFNGISTAFDTAIAEQLTKDKVEEKIKQQKEQLVYTSVDYKEARELKDDSDQRRLQPIYIKLFFEKAFQELGGEYTELDNSIYRIDKMPDLLIRELKGRLYFFTDANYPLLCFDKRVFLEYNSPGYINHIQYINPGNIFFDSLIDAVISKFKEDLLKGTILISPDDKKDYFAFFIKSQIIDSRPAIMNNIADEHLMLVHGNGSDEFKITSPAKLIDLHAPKSFTKKIDPVNPITNEEVTQWCFQNFTRQQFEKAKHRIWKDISLRKAYLEESFTNLIVELTSEINELQNKLLYGDSSVQEKINKINLKISDLKLKKKYRIEQMNLLLDLNMKPPEVLGCAYVIPLNAVEYESHYGMSRDDEVEAIAMQVACDFERINGWNPEDVSEENIGFDIRSTNSAGIKRYIEVKGRSSTGGVMLSENEMNRLSQLGNSAWLYIVVNCKFKPQLYRAQNPAAIFQFETKPKGIQFFLAMDEWKNKAESSEMKLN